MFFPGNQEPNTKTGSRWRQTVSTLKNTGYLLALIPDFTSSLFTPELPVNRTEERAAKWWCHWHLRPVTVMKHTCWERLVFLFRCSPWFRCVSEHDFISEKHIKNNEGIMSHLLKLHNLWPWWCHQCRSVGPSDWVPDAARNFLKFFPLI